jgi:Sortase domain
MAERISRISRRAALAGAPALALFALSRTWVGYAQDAQPATIATPAAGPNSIRPTGAGEAPSTGGERPGPAGLSKLPARNARVAPVELAVETAGIDAAVEQLRVVDGAMQDPTGPWIVAWYDNLGSLGRPGNVVMAGHIDYWNVGPAVFYNLAAMQPGDQIVVTGDDSKTYPFAVDWVRQYDSGEMPLDEVAGPTTGQSLTLITCGGAFDYATAHYLQRTVVRASRSGPGVIPSA